MAAPPIKTQQMDSMMGGAEKDQKIRITLTGREVSSLERATSVLKKQAQRMQIKVKGPVRMPTKVLRLTVRKAPCGEGTNTYDRFQMRIHKRVIEIYTSANLIKQIASIAMEPGVSIDMKVEDYYSNIKTVTNSVNKQFKPEYKKADVLRK